MTSTRRPQIRRTDETGQTLTEYSLILVVIAIGVLVVFPTLQSAISGLFSAAYAAFPN